MIRWINLVKDAFFIYDDFKASGQRLSKTMVTGALAILSSILIFTGVIDTGFTDAEVMAIGTGLYSRVIMVIRLRSDGGRIKLRDDLQPKSGNRSGTGNESDEHATEVIGKD